MEASWSALAIAGEETLLPPGQRYVKGLIAVDSELKPSDEARRLAACANADSIEALIGGGNFMDDSGVLLKLVGDLAKFAPGDSSPIFPAPFIPHARSSPIRASPPASPLARIWWP